MECVRNRSTYDFGNNHEKLINFFLSIAQRYVEIRKPGYIDCVLE